MKILHIATNPDINIFEDPTAPLIQIKEFNWNVVNISFKYWEFGFVYRRRNQKPFKFAWYKNVWNVPEKCWAFKVCSFKDCFKPWNPNNE